MDLRGHRYSYVNARCAVGFLQTHGLLTFSNGYRLSGTLLSHVRHAAEQRSALRDGRKAMRLLTLAGSPLDLDAKSDEWIRSAPSSPAGPIEPRDLNHLPRPPSIGLPAALQVLSV